MIGSNVTWAVHRHKIREIDDMWRQYLASENHALVEIATIANIGDVDRDKANREFWASKMKNMRNLRHDRENFFIGHDISPVKWNI